VNISQGAKIDFPGSPKRGTIFTYNLPEGRVKKGGRRG
jgi:hypothetical protein